MQGHVRMIKVLLKGCLVLVALGVTLAGCSKPKTEEESTGYPEPGSKGTLFLQLQRLLGIQA